MTRPLSLKRPSRPLSLKRPTVAPDAPVRRISNRMTSKRYLKGGTCLDGRTDNGRFLACARQDLLASLNGKPNFLSKSLVERGAWLMLHISLLDEKTARTGQSLNDHDTRIYLAYVNSFSRILVKLGLQNSPLNAASSITDYLNDKYTGVELEEDEDLESDEADEMAL